MKKKPIISIFGPTLIFLTITLLTQPVRAQFSAGLSVAANSPMRSTADSLPGIRTGGSFALRGIYSFGPRMSTNLTVGRRMMNTSGGFEALAHQYGYTREKGFSIHSRSAGMTVLALGVGVNLLSTGSTDCGMPKPSLILGVQGGALITDSKIDGEVRNEAGATVFAQQQTGKTSSPFYQLSLDLLYPVSNNVSILTGAAWSRAASKMDLQRNSNGSSTQSHFTYSDLQLSVGVQIAFKKSINEKGIKRSQSIALPSTDQGSASGDNDPSGQPQARTEGQPIGGIVVKGGQNPGSGKRPKGNAMVAGSPIGGIVVKGGQNPRPKGNAMVEGAPIKGVIVKGGSNGGTKRTGMVDGNPIGGDTSVKASALAYTDDFAITNPYLLSYLGTDQLIIEKGEYPFDYSANPDGKVLLHLHSNGIVHRDLAARSFLFEGTNPDGQTFSYSIEPQYVNGVAKDILVTYKGISEKGIK